MRHLLIDYESHQPADLAPIADGENAVMIFVGPQQNRLPFILVDAMQRLGSRGRYVEDRHDGPQRARLPSGVL